MRPVKISSIGDTNPSSDQLAAPGPWRLTSRRWHDRPGKIFRAAVLLSWLSLGLSQAAFADVKRNNSSSEFLVFLSGEYLRTFGADNPGVDTSDFTPAMDVLYLYSEGPWRFLAEYLLTDKESELERLQVGFDASEDSTFWIGRFHQPSNAWVAKYHHGRFLQTSISRPAIEEWEDDGGVLPTHISGLMLDQGIPLQSGAGTRVTIAVGAGPYIKDQELLPFDFLHPSDGKHGLSAGLSLAYFPDYLAATNFGLSTSLNQIKVLADPVRGITEGFNIEQRLVSLQADWRKQDWQIVAAIYYVNNSSDDVDDSYGGWFSAGYAEIQRSFGDASTAFFRGEMSNHAAGSGYLGLFRDFMSDRIAIGFRQEISANQAISLEFSEGSSLFDSNKKLHFQWSAVFP